MNFLIRHASGKRKLFNPHLLLLQENVWILISAKWMLDVCVRACVWVGLCVFAEWPLGAVSMWVSFLALFPTENNQWTMRHCKVDGSPCILIDLSERMHERVCLCMLHIRRQSAMHVRRPEEWQSMELLLMCWGHSNLILEWRVRRKTHLLFSSLLFSSLLLALTYAPQHTFSSLFDTDCVS